LQRADWIFKRIFRYGNSSAGVARRTPVAVSKIGARFAALIRGADTAREFKERDKERKSVLRETTYRLQRVSGDTSPLGDEEGGRGGGGNTMRGRRLRDSRRQERRAPVMRALARKAEEEQER